MTDTVAQAKANEIIPGYKSKAEEQWAQYGDLILQDELGKPCVHQHYEPIAFYIPGGRYKPDFMHIMEDGEVVFIEVKASKKQRGYRASRQKLRAAAEVYAMFTWYMAIDTELERI